MVRILGRKKHIGVGRFPSLRQLKNKGLCLYISCWLLSLYRFEDNERQCDGRGRGLKVSGRNVWDDNHEGYHIRLHMASARATTETMASLLNSQAKSRLHMRIDHSMECQSRDQEYFVQLNNFSSLPRSHLVFTRVQDPKAVPHLGKLGGTFVFHKSPTPPLRHYLNVKEPEISKHFPSHLIIGPPVHHIVAAPIFRCTRVHCLSSTTDHYGIS